MYKDLINELVVSKSWKYETIWGKLAITWRDQMKKKTKKKTKN